MLQAQQVVDDLEALGPIGIVDPADIDQQLKEAVAVVAQEGQQADDAVGVGPHDQLVVADLEARDLALALPGDVVAEVLQSLVHGRVVSHRDLSVRSCRRA